MSTTASATRLPLSRRAIWWLAIRPRTLGASIAPVAVGVALASRAGPIDARVALATLLAAVLLQITANLANDYADFARGVDVAGRLGPPRVTQTGLLDAATVRRGMLAVLALAAVCGALAIRASTWPILLLGLVLMAAAVAYSAGPWPLASYGLGECLAFTCFGPVAICGTVYLQQRPVGLATLAAALPVGCLVTAIMVVNNLRDIPTDRVTGKRTLAVRLGATGTRRFYTALVLAAFVVLLPLAYRVAAGAILPLVAAPIAVREIRALWERQGSALNLSLVGTARLHLIAGGLLALGIAW